jgi:hypothetical protein
MRYSRIIWEEGRYQSVLREGNQTGYKIKKTAIMAALDIRLARMHRSPERCARNLMELGQASFPDKLSEEERLDIFRKLVSCCKSKDFHEARNLFIETFLS